MSSPISSPAPDPYDQPPPWWHRRANWVWAGGVGVLTAVLAVISFPPVDGPEFAYALAVPAVFWAYRRPPFRLYALTVLAAQAVAWTVLLWWLRHVTWGGLFLLGPLIGAWVGVWYLAAWWAMPRMAGRQGLLRVTAVFGLAGLWVLLEWSRTWFLSGFPWLPLAASQWQRTSILQIAAYTGAGGVSFVLVTINLGFAAVAHSLFREGRTGWRLRRPEFLVGLFLLMVCLSVHVQEAFNRGRFSQRMAAVALVQPAIPQEVKWDPARAPGILEVFEQAMLVAGANEPDLILWPESSTPWALRGDADVHRWIEALVTRSRAPLVLGANAIENSGRPDEAWYNAMFVVTPDGGVQQAYYGKRHLVPFGEYVPFRALLGWLNKFVPIGEGDFRPGPTPGPLIVPVRNHPIAIGPLVCYEDIFPALARGAVRAGADCLFVASNNAWYGEGGMACQHAAHSVLRAVETRRPVLRCSNGGWSGWIDEFGAIRGVMTDDRGSVYFRGVKLLPVKRDERWIGRRSFYVEHGDWFVAVCAALAVIGFLALRIGVAPDAPGGDAVDQGLMSKL
ncbi:MAG: apolipoprotein N-acyltransferase [Verrucomicrobia bacterium RIFCSPLOWO2_12_FULL_64_8]|nr:MAG: apolipoprotein N-acyltransferase [Verrucomicrobia bacterium RIFCSPLOWO2_12_FULL_64_8]